MKTLPRISGFSFIHNAIEAGYPIVEAISVVKEYVDDVYVVDCASTDNTREILEKLKVNIIDGEWGDEAGKTLKKAHSLYKQCSGDVIVHFEGDEVYDPELMKSIKTFIEQGYQDISVKRIQVEQNFQRVRWYTHFVHRVFSKNSGTFKVGNTTNRKSIKSMLFVNKGTLWDCTNCFRDNWIQRVDNQKQLWNNPAYLLVPLHAKESCEYDRFEAIEKLKEPHWNYTESPFNLPKSLARLVGSTKYNPYESLKCYG